MRLLKYVRLRLAYFAACICCMTLASSAACICCMTLASSVACVCCMSTCVCCILPGIGHYVRARWPVGSHSLNPVAITNLQCNQMYNVYSMME